MSAPQLATIAAAAYRRRAGTAAAGDLDLFEEVALRPLAGGLNDPVYRLRHDGRDLCLKLPLVDHRRRAHREWQTLTLLARRGHPRTPCPVWCSHREDQPAIAMTFVAGAPLAGTCLNSEQLDALAAALVDLYSITPADVVEPVAQVVTPAPEMLRRVRDDCTTPTFGPARGPIAGPDRLQLLEFWQRWSSGPDPQTLLRAPTMQILGRGDPNLANLLWDGAELTLLDFEYSGWTDPAYELADLLEHPESRATPDPTWNAFVDRFHLDADARARHRAARRMFALFWLARRRSTDDRRTGQADRVRHLLGAAA